jgi:hypothetical protein
MFFCQVPIIFFTKRRIKRIPDSVNGRKNIKGEYRVGKPLPYISLLIACYLRLFLCVPSALINAPVTHRNTKRQMEGSGQV